MSQMIDETTVLELFNQFLQFRKIEPQPEQYSETLKAWWQEVQSRCWPGGNLFGESFFKYVSGVEVPGKIPDLSEVPYPIQRMTNPRRRERALSAWHAASQLSAVIELWLRFLQLASLNLRADTVTEMRIAALFPKLENYGRVLDALLEASPQTEEDIYWARVARVIQEAADPNLKRFAGYDKRPYRGKYLSQLIANFHDVVTSRIKTLQQVGVKSGLLIGSDPAARVARLMACDCDFTGKHAPIDVGKKLQEVAGAESLKLVSEVRGLLTQVETAPGSVLSVKEPGQARPPKRGRKPDPNVERRNIKMTEVWANRIYRTYRELGAAFDVSEDTARKVVRSRKATRQRRPK